MLDAPWPSVATAEGLMAASYILVDEVKSYFLVVWEQ